MRRYLRLLAIQIRTSLILAAQYRIDFLLDAAIELFWGATALVPLLVVFRAGRSIAGWSFPEALLVVGWFHVLNGLLEGVVNPGLQQVVEHIRNGTLDFVLLKPADAQFLVSTTRFQLSRALNGFTALVVFVWAFRAMHRVPTLGGVFLSLAILLFATAIVYAIWILIVSAAFFVVKVDNLTYLFSSILDAARWPSSVFRGVVRFVFTFVLPLAVMTTFPARALLGTLPTGAVLASGAGAIAFLVVARLVWLRSIARYTSASS